MDLEVKRTSLELKADVDKREIKGYAATFNGRDSYDDTILRGAFADTLAAKFRPSEGHVKIRTLWNHDWDIPIGKPTAIHEDEKGLAFSAKLAKTKAADDVLELIREGVVEEMSIGYTTVKSSFIPDDSADFGYVRILEKIDLWEISPVTFGADSNTAVDAKAARCAEIKAAGFKIKAGAIAALHAEIKAGRVLSQKNLNKLKDALAALQDVISAAELEAEEGSEKSAQLGALDTLKSINFEIAALASR